MGSGQVPLEGTSVRAYERRREGDKEGSRRQTGQARHRAFALIRQIPNTCSILSVWLSQRSFHKPCARRRRTTGVWGLEGDSRIEIERRVQMDGGVGGVCYQSLIIR